MATWPRDSSASAYRTATGEDRAGPRLGTSVIEYNAPPQKLDNCPALSPTPAQQRVLEAVTAAAARAGLTMASNLKILTFRGEEGVTRGTAVLDQSSPPTVLLDVSQAPPTLAHTFAHELSHVSDSLNGRPVDFGRPEDLADDERRANEFADRIWTQPEVVAAVEAAGGGPAPTHDHRHTRPITRLSDCPAMRATAEHHQIFLGVGNALMRDGVRVPPGEMKLFTVRGIPGLPHGQTLRARETGKVSVWLDLAAPLREVARAFAEQMVHVADLASGRPFDKDAWDRRARRVAARVLAQREVLTAIGER